MNHLSSPSDKQVEMYRMNHLSSPSDKQVEMYRMNHLSSPSDKQVEIDEPKSCQMGSGTCNTLFGGWTVGSAGQCLYKEAGFRIGQNGISRVMMQVRKDVCYLDITFM